MQDSSRSLSYLFVTEGDVYPGPGNAQHSYVTVLNTNTRKVRLLVLALALTVWPGL